MKSKREAAIRAFPGTVDHGDGLVSFAIYAPQKKSVNVIGSFNNWDHEKNPLEQTEPGYWVTELQLDKGSYQYQFVIDQELVICDPYARYVEAGKSSDDQPLAIFEVGAEPYHWEHDDWLRHSFNDLIIYEMHIGDFTEKGTFAGAMEKLEHLAELGVTAIELMPVYEADEDDYWGYKPTYLMAPRRSYGSPEDFQRFVDAAHSNNLAVILDMVLAHTSHKHPFNRMYPYEQSPWYGSGLGEKNQYGLPTFDYLKDPTNFFVRDVQSHWLEAYHIDGFRYDYLAGIGANAEGKGLPNLMKRAMEIQPDAFFIGECIPEDPELVNNSGLGAVWHSRCRIALQSLLIETDIEPYSWSRFSEAVKAFDPSTQGYKNPRFMVNYVECHDDKRLMFGLHEADFDEQTARKKSALAATVLMTIPGEPMLYHGQEWGESSPVSQKQNKIRWENCQTDTGKDLLEHHRLMCRIRRSRSSTRSENFAMPVIDEQKRCIVYHRGLGESDQVVVAVNFSAEKQSISIPLPQPGYWHEPESEPFEADETTDRQIDAYSSIILLSGES